jgi:tRNA(adenine34) deaminase
MHLTKKNIFFAKKLYNFIKKNYQYELPIGALIIRNNTIISLKKNKNEGTPLDHAECLVIRETIAKHSTTNLSQYLLFTSLEPCLMCIGAAIHANIKTIYYLCKSPESGIQTKFNIYCIPNISIIPLLIYENKINLLIKLFFQNKRKS